MSGKKDKKVCLSCYWAYPDDYTHVGMKLIRRLDLIWDGDETEKYERLKKDALSNDSTLPSFVKQIILKHLDNKP